MRLGIYLVSLTTMFAAPAAHAALVDVTISIENLAPANTVSFAPLRFAFNSGVYDSFNAGSAATAPIISIAEGGTAEDWFPAFMAADPTATFGSSMGPLTPGASATVGTFRVDTAINAFFTFGSMVIPSNDLFIGNDDPMEYRLFDSAGNLVVSEILQTGSEIWNAGSEIADPAAAAFLVGGNNSLRTPENGVVNFSFGELSAYEGLTTAANYRFTTQGLAASTPIYRIRFSAASAVPEPTTWAMMVSGFGLIGSVLRRKSTGQTATV